MKLKEIKDGVIENLLVEITRNCNFKCNHCLRGEAQNKNIELFKLREFLYENKVEQISSLTITGGEPLMFPDLLEKLSIEIRMMNISVGYIYIATNGSYFNFEAFEALSSLYSVIEEGICLEVSNSVYHQQERERLGVKLLTNKDFVLEHIKDSLIEELRNDFEEEEELEDVIYNKMYSIYDMFEKEDFNIELDSRTYKSLISEGRGTAIGGFKEAEISEDLIYFSAKGEIIIGKCDLSFKSQRKEKIKF